MPYKDRDKKRLYDRIRSNAYYQTHKSQVKLRSKVYHEKNREKIRQQRKEYYQKNRDKILAKVKENYELGRDPIIIKKRLLQRKRHIYYIKNKEKIIERTRQYYKKNRLKYTIWRKLWSKSHPKHGAHQSALRRLRIKGVAGRHTHKEWIEKCKLYRNRCFYCGKKGILTKDHKIPVSLGGNNNISNIVPSCLSCNIKKFQKTLEQFLYECKIRNNKRESSDGENDSILW